MCTRLCTYFAFCSHKVLLLITSPLLQVSREAPRCPKPVSKEQQILTGEQAPNTPCGLPATVTRTGTGGGQALDVHGVLSCNSDETRNWSPPYAVQSPHMLWARTARAIPGFGFQPLPGERLQFSSYPTLAKRVTNLLQAIKC